jgi:ribosomal subunit interface protein
MIQKFEIQGVHYDVDDNIRKYVTKKIGGLDRYISRHNRTSVHAEVTLKEGKAKNHNRYTCEVTIYVPQETINVSESSLNMFAAVDIVEAKLKHQLRKYKETNPVGGRQRRHLLARFRRRAPRIELTEDFAE